jgi:tripartite ATP-independent transporter DctM subunit
MAERARMIEGALLLLGVFFALLFLGVPLGVALGISGTLVIALNGLGVMAVPANVWTGIAKYPLLALPVFVLAGMVFERSGVAERLVRFASAVVGNRTGGLALVAILVCIVLGGISGSGPADAAAVATVLAPGMLKQGYPRPFTASLVAAAGSTAILIPPSIAFIVYAVLVPGVSVPALFIGGIVPGLLAGLSLMIPALWFAHRYGFGRPDPDAQTPSLWASFKEAAWGLAAPVVILGGLRSGAFTPTEAAVVAVFYGLFVGLVIYRTLDLLKIYDLLRESAEISAVVMIIIALATIFAYAGSTVGAFDAFAM